MVLSCHYVAKSIKVWILFFLFLSFFVVLIGESGGWRSAAEMSVVCLLAVCGTRLLRILAVVYGGRSCGGLTAVLGGSCHSLFATAMVVGVPGFISLFPLPFLFHRSDRFCRLLLLPSVSLLGETELSLTAYGVLMSPWVSSVFSFWWFWFTRRSLSLGVSGFMA